MIDALQSLVFAKPDKLLLSIKSFINQHDPTFTHALSFLINSQSQNKWKLLTRNTYLGSNDGFIRSVKLIKALLDPYMFNDRKNLSID